MQQEPETNTANGKLTKTSNDTSKSSRHDNLVTDISTRAIIHCPIDDLCNDTVLTVSDHPLQPEDFGNEDIPFIDD